MKPLVTIGKRKTSFVYNKDYYPVYFKDLRYFTYEDDYVRMNQSTNRQFRYAAHNVALKLLEALQKKNIFEPQ